MNSSSTIDKLAEHGCSLQQESMIGSAENVNPLSAVGRGWSPQREWFSGDPSEGLRQFLGWGARLSDSRSGWHAFRTTDSDSIEFTALSIGRGQTVIT
mmetsp:Transcript_41245/g.162678  ORF Transcript_41245/g.162678 Transcript_41245/m.162678 type:complete len:98 (+) Transcript_41245:515-808(+)